MNSQLLKFIKEARKRGFDDFEIREPLLKKGWNLEEIEKIFAYLEKRKVPLKFKNRVCIWLDNQLLNLILKRAKKNMMNAHEQIEDILRRSCLNLKITKKEEKIDDLFLSFFSRKR
jgi:molybdenum cofactor biosynthesis enzyme MoaA